MKKGIFFRIVLFLFCFLTCPSLAQGIIQSEYWFDGDVVNKVVNKMNGNETYEIVSKIPTAQLDDGLHQFNFRVMQSDGMYSPVLTRSFFKMSGKMNLLEYWFDGDNSNVRYIYGKITDGNTVFQEQIDLSDVSEGVHRLYYRGISVDGVSSTAISSTPIMVKPRNNFDPNQQKVVSYSVAVDDETAINYNIMEPAAEIFQHNIQKLSGLKEGNHKVTVKAWNTAGAGVSQTKTFKVSKLEPPKLELTTTVEGGIVFLDLNTIPGGQDYEICRVLSSRTSKDYVPIYKGQQVYPNYNISYDVPDEEGHYRYIGRCWYYDESHKKQTLESKEVEAYVEIANKDRNNLGYIFGEVLVPVNKLAYIELYDQNGNLIPNNYVGIDSETGTFKTSKFPVGTVLTLKVDNFIDGQYLFKNETVTLKPGRNDVKITGMKVDGVQPDNYAADLYFDSNVTYVSNQYFKFKLKNETMLPWKGLVRARIIRKAEDKNSTNWNALPEMGNNQFFIYAEGRQIEWAVNESKEVILPLNSLLINETEDYYVYFETVEAPNNDIKRIGLSFRKELEIEGNPVVYTLEKNNDGYRSASELAVEMADLALATMMLKSDYFDERLGNVREFLEQVQKGVKDAQYNVSLNEEEKKWIASLDPDIWTYESLVVRIQEHYRDQPRDDVKGLARIISDVLQKNPETLQYIIEQRTEMSLTLQEMLGPLYHVGAGVSKVYGVWEKVKKYYDMVTGVFENIEAYQRMEPHTQYFYKAKTFINVASEAISMISSDFAPFARILKTYMDIAEHTVNYALDNETYKYQHEESWLMKNLEQGYNSDYLCKNKNNLSVNFRVEVQKPFTVFGQELAHIINFDFTDKDAQKQILETNIYLSDQKDDKFYDVIRCSQKFDDSGFYLIPDYYENNSGILDGINTPLQKLLLEIRWRNGRTSVIPLKDECEGVSFSTWGGAHYTVTFNSESTDPRRMADVLYLLGDKEDNTK